ncbi:F-box/WD repeat-containing protein 11 [Sphaceloma murrayae]|uniref:F-box/WD repeat-containing protein 11 n=1 Tax=Sphaceloma murrayae TaxID=2082308 RepID=A0A2K1QYJ9_9PEZI|nr:F-box/WD repeat-containing protein 11 [Sphaceloma murrayae]
MQSTSLASSHTPFLTTSDDIVKPAFASSTSSSKPIDIPAKRPSSSRHEFPPVLPAPNQNTEKLASRKRRDNVNFRDVQWGSKQQDILEREQLALSYQRVGSPSRSSSSSSKKRDGKETGIFRRTSVSCRNKFQKAIAGRSRRSSVDHMEGVDGAAYPEANPFYQTRGTFMDRITHPKGMLQTLKVSRYDTPQPVNGAASSSAARLFSQRPVSAQYYESQLPTINQSSQSDARSGHAARKAAAAANSGARAQLPPSPPSPFNYLETREQNRRRLGSNSSAADSGADICSSSDIDMPDLPEPDVIKLDPITYLPLELNALVFSYLDAPTLRACQKIGPWKALASDPLIWRGEYLRNFNKKVSVTPAPIQIGGVGIGMHDQKLQNWQLMHSAREQINTNWANGKGRAVYMAGHTDSVYCVQFDEQKIITGSRDRTIRVWDLNTNRCIKVIGGPTVRPTPGPRVLRTVDYPSFHHAEASVNGTAYGHHIYHVPSDFHSASILCLQYDDEILVTGSSDNDLIVWDIKTYEPIQRLKHHQGGVLDVAFDAKHIVSCSKDCTIVVWDRKTLKPLRTLTGHNGPVNAVQLRGNLLVSASGDGVARLWDLNKMECVREFPAKERGLAAVEFSDDAKYVLAGGNDHVTYKFEVATGNEVLQYSGHTQLVRSLFLDTQNKRVVSGSYDLDLRVYDYESGELITVFPEWTTSWMLAAKCDYRRIVSTSQDGRILMIDFGINQDGQKIEGVDLLGGCEPWVHEELDRLYPNFSHPNVPKP